MEPGNGIFDSHAHYDDAAFDADRSALLESLPQRGVCGVINAGSHLESSAASVALAARYPFCYAAVGVHPECVNGLPEGYLARLRALAAGPKVVAVGEIGLDYHFADMAPKEDQRRVLEEQLGLAEELRLPVILHDRDAHGDMMEILRRRRPRGVLHCFSGSVEMMREAVSLGLYIGLGGAVTFKNARVPVEVARAVPAERLLLETDAPYMAPVPFRGKRCDSAMIAYTAARIAEIRGETVETVLRHAREAAAALFSRMGG